MTPTRRLLPAARLAAACAAVAALATSALADEYAVSSFTGGYVEPPPVKNAQGQPANGSTVAIGTGQDDATAEVTLPFEFPFFGRLQTKVSVCSNGWLAFGSTTATVSDNPSLPSSAAPNGIVAALWDDLQTGTGTVKTFTTGTAPDRIFVIAWHHVDTFSGSSSDDLSFEVLLHEATGTVEIVYAAAGTWSGLSYTAGIEDPTGTVAFGAGSLGNAGSGQPALSWRFVPSTVAVTGAVLRDRPVADATGLGNSTESGLPVAGIDLEVRREDTGEVAARGRSADDGTFAVAVLGIEGDVTFRVDLLASGAESRVVDASGAVHRLTLATDVPLANPDAGTHTLDAATDSTNASIRRAVNVQQAAQRGFAWARGAAAAAVEGTDPAVAAETFPRLDFRFVADGAASAGRTQYAPASAQGPAVVHVHDAAPNRDPWDDDVILRECGNHVLAAISVAPGLVDPRSWEQATTTVTAFADGFAHWFACVVQERTTFIDTRTDAQGAPTATVFDLEAATPAPAVAPDVTGAVACSLWDLVDPANETWDEIEGTLGGAGSTAYEVFRTIDLDLDAATSGHDAPAFFGVWRASGPIADRVATARIFIHHGGLADDRFEPNDRAGEESAIQPSVRLDALVLSPYNDDRFRVAFAPAEDTPLTVAVAQTTAADFDVEILDGGGTRVGFGTNAGATAKDRVVVTTDAPVPAGTYDVVVAWRAGPAGAYTLSAAEPLRLALESLPAWTAGHPYKVDLVVAGGVAPYAYTTTAQVPGISVANSGARLIGTPTTAGSYPVRVRALDASGSAAEVDVTLTLVVNRALTMPPLFGLPSGTSVGADVGRGGTDAVWTAESPGDGALVLEGGSALTLTGGAGPARTFTVTGSAVDGVGAVLPTTTSRVVVCEALPARVPVAVPAGSHFGVWFDAFAGSRCDLRFRFTGVGERPVLTALVDEAGDAVDLQGHVRVRGRVVRIEGVRLPRSSRWYAIFAQTSKPFSGRVASAGQVRAPREAHGIVVIDPADEVAEATFEAECGSRLRIVVRGEMVPEPVRAQVLGLLDPEGGSIAVSAQRPLRADPGVRAVARASESLRGTHTLRIGGDGDRTGPVFWRVRIGRSRDCSVRF